MADPELSFSKCPPLQCLGLCLLLSFVGCGGTGSSTPPPTQVSIQLNQSSATVVPGATVQFTAQISGTSNTAVTWTVDTVSGGNSSKGTVSNGLYTAPQQASTHVVTATSVADTTKSASATVTVQGNVAITPGTETLLTGAIQQFQATVSGQSSSSVVWSVDGISGGNSTLGTINSGGLYTAPSQPGNHSIGAASATNAADSATAAVTVFSFVIAPTGATVAQSGTQQFTATINGITNTGVTWTVDGVAGGNPNSGTISTTGMYTAPSQAGTHTIAATSVADTAAIVSTTVSVSGTISISPNTATLVTSATQQFTATVTGQTNATISWSVDGVAGGNASVGTISSNGLYTAPALAGSHTITAASGTNTADSATAPITVFSFAISPTSAAVGQAATQQFTTTIQGLTNTSVTWSVDGVAGGNASSGTVSTTGLYTAPSQQGTHTVAATSVADTAASVSATLNVAGPILISPTTATLVTSMTQQFTATVTGITNPTISWLVDGVTGGNETVGTISSSGLYTAPALAGAHTVTASDGTSSGDNASAQLTIFSFTITPSQSAIGPSTTQQFAATVSGITNTGVTWLVDGVTGGNSSVGTISTSGLYTAPSGLGAHTVTAASVAYPADVVNAPLTVINEAPLAVLTYHNDDARDGAYTQETTLMPSNVNSTQFGKLVSYPVDGQIYGQPLYVPQLTINGAKHDVVFVATQNNSVYAFDADATSSNPSTFWQVNLGAPKGAYDDAGPWPVVGVLSTPVIDSTTKTIYVVTHLASGTPEYWLHALDITTGKDKVSAVGLSGSVEATTLVSAAISAWGWCWIR